MSMFNLNNVLAVVQKTSVSPQNLSIIITIIIVIIIILVISTLFDNKK